MIILCARLATTQPYRDTTTLRNYGVKLLLDAIRISIRILKDNVLVKRSRMRSSLQWQHIGSTENLRGRDNLMVGEDQSQDVVLKRKGIVVGMVDEVTLKWAVVVSKG